MPSKIYEINLDIKDSQYKLVPFIEVVSGDTDANIFNIQLLENFKPVNTSGNTVVIIFGKPDRTTVFQNLTVVDATTGKFTCTLSSQTIAVPGRIQAEVALYEGTKKLTSVTFEFVVRKPILDEKTVESSNEFSALTEALGQVTDLKNLAGEGRTAETVKGNADAIKSHEADIVTDSNGAHGLKIETGTFTPIIVGETTPGTNTYSAQEGTYYKIGSLIHFRIRIILTAKDVAMAGNVAIAGLPFVEQSPMHDVASVVWSNVSLDGQDTVVFGRINTAQAKINFYKGGANVYASLLNAVNITDSTNFIISGVYRTN